MLAQDFNQFEISSHPAVENSFSIIETQVLDDCEKILSTVSRWTKWDIKAISSQETNREHVLWMLDMVWEFHRPLSNICDVEELILMILIHDLWEYRIGDIARSEKWAEKKKLIQKKHEKKVATILINKIKNTGLREKCLSLLDRYFDFWIGENQGLHELDRLYLLTKLFDTAQWLEYGLETVFLENHPVQKSEVEKHIRACFQEMANICIYLDASVILWTKTHYDLYAWKVREFKRQQEKAQRAKLTENWIYVITNSLLDRIAEKIKTHYNLDVEAELDGMIQHFWGFRYKHQK